MITIDGTAYTLLAASQAFPGIARSFIQQASRERSAWTLAELRAANEARLRASAHRQATRDRSAIRNAINGIAMAGRQP